MNNIFWCIAFIATFLLGLLSIAIGIVVWFITTYGFLLTLITSVSGILVGIVVTAGSAIGIIDTFN